MEKIRAMYMTETANPLVVQEVKYGTSLYVHLPTIYFLYIEEVRTLNYGVFPEYPQGR